MSRDEEGSPVSEDDRLARVTLSVVGEPGDARLLDLAADLGPAGLLQALHEKSDKGDLFAAVRDRLAEVEPERELERAQRLGIRFVVPRALRKPGLLLWPR